MFRTKSIIITIIVLILGVSLFLSGYHYALLRNRQSEQVKTESHLTKKSSTSSQKTEKNCDVDSKKAIKPESSKQTETINQPTKDMGVLDQSSKEEVNQRKTVKLDVTPQVQRAWNTCSPTTVSMLLSYKGILISQEELAKEMGTDDSFGTHNEAAIAVLNKHLFGYAKPDSQQAGYRLERVSDVTSALPLFKKRFLKNIDDGYPMYLTFDVSKLHPGRSGEHNVLGIGYQLSEDGTDMEYIYYLDPSYTVQDPIYGGLKKVTPEELLTAMLTCVEPEYAW